MRTLAHNIKRYLNLTGCFLFAVLFYYAYIQIDISIHFEIVFGIINAMIIIGEVYVLFLLVVAFVEILRHSIVHLRVPIFFIRSKRRELVVPLIPYRRKYNLILYSVYRC
jgi:hypothetical protein